MATVKYSLLVLRELVRAGTDLNVQNQVTVQLNDATDESLISPPLGRTDSSNDLLTIWQN